MKSLYKMSKYNYDYFERGTECGISGYDNYRWLPDLTVGMCSSIIKKLKVEKKETILDFGCAKGFSVKALRMLGYKAYGCDVSEYAVSKAPSDISGFLTIQTDTSEILGTFERYDWIFSKDVLEHISYDEIDKIIQQFKAQTDNIFIAVPLGDGEKYIVPDYENDVTHVIRENKDWWMQKFVDAGFENLEFCYEFPNVKENWWTKYPLGNLFIYTGRQ